MSRLFGITFVLFVLFFSTLFLSNTLLHIYIQRKNYKNCKRNQYYFKTLKSHWDERKPYYNGSVFSKITLILSAKCMMARKENYRSITSKTKSAWALIKISAEKKGHLLEGGVCQFFLSTNRNFISVKPLIHYINYVNLKSKQQSVTQQAWA